ncbi:hypothetical protein K488DRAFT_8061, partial [Vararia minispora EC-137]
FSHPGHFAHLTELVLDGAPLVDRDVLLFHRLPSLSALHLANTAISDESVFHLVALRHTLARLSLRNNTSITDDACPALALLTRLFSLDLAGTAIRMPGLRRLARAEQLVRALALDAPAPCETYLDTLHTRYLLAPAAPLITSPRIVSVLSTAALRRNLAAHAAHNRALSAAVPARPGADVAARERLRALLEMRRADLGVRAMVWRKREE